MELLAGSLLASAAFAQVTGNPVEVSGSSTSTTTTTAPSLQTYLQEQRALAREWRTLAAQGATQQQLAGWRQQNATQFQAQQQLAQTLCLESALQPALVIQQVNIPANTSGALADLLTTQAALASARAQIHNQLLQALPSAVTAQQVEAMRQQQAQIFQQQYAADLQLQTQRAQALAAESASQPLRVPGPPVFPPNATPQLQAFLIARNTLAIERAQLWNQYLTADPATRQAAIQQWRQQNAAQFQQLSQLARNISNSTATQEGISQ
jgi:hypothetical protein